MDASRPSALSATAPAQLAKGALRRLAQSQQEPTPENYARAYAEESGQAAPAMPDKAMPLIERLVARAAEDPAQRTEMVDAMRLGRWDVAGQWLDRVAQAGGTQSQALAALFERLARGLEQGGRQWTAARKKESLQRVLDGSRGDARRLQQRLGSLLGAWESDGAIDGPPERVEEADADATGRAPPAAQASEVRAADWAPLWAAFEGTVRTALPPDEPRAAALADELSALADRIARDGATPALVAAVEAVCAQTRRLLGHRHHLLDQLGTLCHELSRGLTELAEDDSWARGQCENLQARLAAGIHARSVRAATELLAETRERQQRVRGERNAARDALKLLITRMLTELGELGAHTGRFQQSVERHAQAIERAESLESLAGVVRELVDDSRAVKAVVSHAQQRLDEEHARAGELETRVRELEGELRQLSEQVSTDALTQVANRRGLQQTFEAECARLARVAPGAESPVLAVGLIDIDNFKRLNDSLGHSAGDEALRALAKAVREQLRPADHLARFGGEEFVVLMPDTPAADALQVLTRLQRSLSASLFMHDNKEVFVTFSGGVTAWRPGEALEAALERADEALYDAKRSGKNRTCLG
jgi:diguanylate cyclase